jgi:hypothetical protein
MEELRTWLVTSLPEADLDLDVYLEYIIDTLDDIPVDSDAEKEAAADAVAELFELLKGATEVDLAAFRKGLLDRWSVIMDDKAAVLAKEVEKATIFSAAAATAAAEREAQQTAAEELAIKEAMVAQYSYVEKQGVQKKTAADLRAEKEKPIGTGKFMKMWRGDA